MGVDNLIKVFEDKYYSNLRVEYLKHLVNYSK